MGNIESDHNRSIKQLLKKYETKQPGEVNFNYDTKKLWREQQKRRYADIVLNRLRMTTGQKSRVHYLIDLFPNFKQLCARCSEETIITALCMYVKFSTTKKEKLNKYGICNENGLTEECYSSIVTRLAINFQLKLKLSHECHV